MKLSLYVGESQDAVRCVDAIVDAERRGLHGAWLPQTPWHRPADRARDRR
jgi:hypothetical protein